MKPVLGNDPVSYKAAMKLHSDHQKFDDMLRMVLDCSDEEAHLIEQYLKDAHRSGDITYGIHFSSTSQMTCFVQGLENGNHIHFIDGGDGGYAIAAKQLKKQVLQSRHLSMPTTMSTLWDL